jgi:hypothetical protein
VDYEFLAKSVAARKVFGHCLRHFYSEQARAWATENFGPEAVASLVEDDHGGDTKTFFSLRYTFDTVGVWAYVSGDYYFRDIDQAFEFKMRWL